MLHTVGGENVFGRCGLTFVAATIAELEAKVGALSKAKTKDDEGKTS